MQSGEKAIRTEGVRQTQIRESVGDLSPLVASLDTEGLHRPIVVWSDGTLISGRRRLMALLMLGKERVPAIFVDTVEDATKRLLGDMQDTHLSLPMKWSEVARLWTLLRRLDEPAAAKRADENRRRGVTLRRQTQAGEREAGRSYKRSVDHVLELIVQPFDVSAATGARVEAIYRAATGPDNDKRDLARELLRDIDDGGPVWPAYQRLLGERPAPVTRPRPAVVTESAPAVKQRAAWNRSLPQLEGLVAGLVELGPPSPGLTWEQVGPTHARLMAVRRELEKIIKQMRESNKS